MDKLICESGESGEVLEVVNEMCNFFDKVNKDNILDLIIEFEIGIVDFWGGYIEFLKVDIVKKLEELNFFELCGKYWE